MKLIGYTDTHYASINPASRLDDYSAALFAKTQQVIAVARAEQADVVLHAGDVFHTKNVSLEYINQLIELYRTFPCPVYGVIGNHDIVFGRSDSVQRTPLGTLLAAGSIQPLGGRVVELDGVTLYGHDFVERPWESLPRPKPNQLNMLVGHAYWEDAIPWAADESLRREHVQEFDLLFLGHDHNPYPLQRFERTTVIRPGSLSRGTQTGAAMDRDVYYFVLDTAVKRLEYRKLEVLPAEKIFSSQVREQREARREVKDFVKSLSNGLQDKALEMSLLLDQLCDEPPVKKRTIDYLQKHGAI